MVGLDAYMCLRYIVVCFKMALFVSLWGFLILIPLYATSNYDTDTAEKRWDRFAISNILYGERSVKYRLWVAALFGYVYAAYFCQLLYAEYNNFSVRRLQYLVQVSVLLCLTHSLVK